MKRKSFEDYVKNLREVHKLCMEIGKQYRDDVREDDHFLVYSTDEGMFASLGRLGAYRVVVAIDFDGSASECLYDNFYYDLITDKYSFPYDTLRDC